MIQSALDRGGAHHRPPGLGDVGFELPAPVVRRQPAILICEQGFNEDRSRGSAYRVYDLATKGLTTLRLPEEWWPSDWSAEGKRLLTSLRTANGSLRVAWVRIDGTGEPEFVTPDQEVAYGAKLSPDNRRILCMVGPKVPEDQQFRMRLYVIDLATKQRTMIDKPGTLTATAGPPTGRRSPIPGSCPSGSRWPRWSGRRT